MLRGWTEERGNESLPMTVNTSLADPTINTTIHNGVGGDGATIIQIHLTFCHVTTSQRALYRVGGCLSPKPTPAPSSTHPEAGVSRSCGACDRSLGEKTVAQTTKRARGNNYV